MTLKVIAAVGGIILAVALVIGWIVLAATGHKADTTYVAVTALAVGHAIGANITTPTVAP